jgi:hypothetical protein
VVTAEIGLELAERTKGVPHYYHRHDKLQTVIYDL